jgi:hypothetical protein
VRVAGLFFPLGHPAVDHVPGSGDRRWEIALPSATAATAAAIALHFGAALGLNGTRVAVVPARGASASAEDTGRLLRLTTTNDTDAAARRGRVKVSFRAGPVHADYLASRDGGPDPPPAEDGVCLDGAGGKQIKTFHLVAYFALVLIPIQVIAVVANGYYEERVGCQPSPDRCRGCRGMVAGSGFRRLSGSARAFVLDLLPRCVGKDALEAIAAEVAARALEAGYAARRAASRRCGGRTARRGTSPACAPRSTPSPRTSPCAPRACAAARRSGRPAGSASGGGSSRPRP